MLREFFCLRSLLLPALLPLRFRPATRGGSDRLDEPFNGVSRRGARARSSDDSLAKKNGARRAFLLPLPILLPVPSSSVVVKVGGFPLVYLYDLSFRRCFSGSSNAGRPPAEDKLSPGELGLILKPKQLMSIGRNFSARIMGTPEPQHQSIEIQQLSCSNTALSPF